MRCKKEIMGLAALMVLLFHFYIPFGASSAEMFFFRSAYIGVDLFFLVSAGSLISRNSGPDFKYGQFILNRLELVYLPFVIMTLIAAVYKKWEILRFLKVIGGVEFYERGGGSFLWYFIGITLIYLTLPLLLLTNRKFKKMGLGILMLFWIVLACLVQYLLKAPQLMILINRLPIFFIGLYYNELIAPLVNKMKGIKLLILELVLLLGGAFTVFKYGTTIRLNKPFSDMYYVLAIPLILGVVILIELVSVKYKSRILGFLGTITLELYALQMIFGYDIEMFLVKKVPVPQLAFIGTVLILILSAYVYNCLYKLLRKQIKKLFIKEDHK